jgi:Cys-tRNA(Pro)/Cys-tRNA(Cys) deacylase
MSKRRKSGVKTMPMRILEDNGIPYRTQQQSHKEYSAEGVAEDLGIPIAQVLKAMLVQRSTYTATDQFNLIVIPGNRRLSLKKVGAEIGDKKLQLASKRDVERITGFKVGSVSVIGFRRDDIPVFIDRSIFSLDKIIISAGRPDMGISLMPSDLLKVIRKPKLGDFCED